MSANTITPHVVSFQCSVCKKQYDFVSNSISCGYAVDRDGNKICYPCCAEADKKEMIETGKKWDLYLTVLDAVECTSDRKTWTATGVGVVSNWPGSLKFPAVVVQTRHKDGNVRIFHAAYFIGPDDKVWIGRHAGEWNDLCHCRTGFKNPGWSEIEIRHLLARNASFLPEGLRPELHIVVINKENGGQ